MTLQRELSDDQAQPQPHEEPGRRGGAPLRLLVVVVLAVEVLLGGIALVRGVYQPVFSNGDEAFHLDYVVRVAHGELPVVGKTLVDPRALAVAQHRYPGPPKAPPAQAGWAGNSYEAIQPPLYYALAAPVSMLSDNWITKVYLLRWFSVAILLLAAVLLVPLGRLLVPNQPALAVAFGLAPFATAGFADQLVRISNDGLLVTLSLAVTVCLVLALRRGSAGWLAGAAVLTAAAILTKVTAAGLVLVLLAVALVLLARDRTLRRAAVLAAASAPSVLLVVPWLLWNHRQYGAFTGTAVLMKLEEPIVNRYHVDYTVTSELAKVPDVLAGLFIGKWPRGTSLQLIHAATLLGAAVVLAAVAATVVASRRRPEVLLTTVPFFLTAVVLIDGAVSNDNPVFHSRLVVGWLPLLLLSIPITASALGWSRRGPTVVTAAWIATPAALAVVGASLGLLLPG